MAIYSRQGHSRTALVGGQHRIEPSFEIIVDSLGMCVYIYVCMGMWLGRTRVLHAAYHGYAQLGRTGGDTASSLQHPTAHRQRQFHSNQWSLENNQITFPVSKSEEHLSANHPE